MPLKQIGLKRFFCRLVSTDHRNKYAFVIRFAIRGLSKHSYGNNGLSETTFVQSMYTKSGNNY